MPKRLSSRTAYSLISATPRRFSHSHGYFAGCRAVGQANLSQFLSTDYAKYREVIKQFIADKNRLQRARTDKAAAQTHGNGGAKKIRECYGDGSDGFVFDGQVKQSDLEELNRQNQQIHDAFDNDLAVKTKYGIFVGERRWKAPEPPTESDEVFEANFFARR